MALDEGAVVEFITETFDGLDAVTASGDTFFFYHPDRTLPADRRLPFATLVTGDRYDIVSQLDRPGVFRLSVGVTTTTIRSAAAGALLAG